VEHVRDEKDVLDSLDHPFCNQLVSTFHDKANVYMLISLCQGGDLLAAHETWKNNRMDESCVQFYLACIVLALEYIPYPNPNPNPGFGVGITEKLWWRDCG